MPRDREQLPVLITIIYINIDTAGNM